jgi:peroxiredoxin Q/BCP
MENKKAPSFILYDQDNRQHSLTDYLGKLILLYFYPKDDTPGCTIEACSFRDSYLLLKKMNIIVLGVSADLSTMHKKFSKKYKLPFPLLADVKREVIQLYGAGGIKNIFVKKVQFIKRESFLINPLGNIVKHYKKVNPKTHVSEVINDVNKN